MAKQWSWFDAWGEDFVEKGFTQALYLGDNEGNEIIKTQIDGSPADITVKTSHAHEIVATPLMREALESWSKLLKQDKRAFFLLTKLQGADEVIRQTAEALVVARGERT